ncbi:MAG: sigma-70 family RNA polymerase sigma factor [Archangiaceae bacterium]|nr:sigma-70 family RNA polymerase sigma factor [Archangiaceae bacterium]
MEKGKLEALYAKIGPVIYARCRRLLKDRAAAEDATQEIFIKILRAADSIPSDDAVMPWVHRVTTNYCLNSIRDARRHAEPMPNESLPELRDDDFEDSVVTKDFAEQLLAQQPEEIKAPVMLYHVKGMEQSRVASWLGVSRRTVLYRLAEFAESARRFEKLADAGRA